MLLVAGATGLILNGGFQYFYERRGDIREVASAFKEIGLEKLADLCIASIQAFADEGILENDNMRVNFLDENTVGNSTVTVFIYRIGRPHPIYEK